MPDGRPMTLHNWPNMTATERKAMLVMVAKKNRANRVPMVRKWNEDPLVGVSGVFAYSWISAGQDMPSAEAIAPAQNLEQAREASIQKANSILEQAKWRAAEAKWREQEE